MKPRLARFLFKFGWQRQVGWIECLWEYPAGKILFAYSNQRTIGKQQPTEPSLPVAKIDFSPIFLPTELESKSIKNSSSRFRQVALPSNETTRIVAPAQAVEYPGNKERTRHIDERHKKANPFHTREILVDHVFQGTITLSLIAALSQAIL